MEGISDFKTPIYQISNYLDYLCAAFELFLIIFLIFQHSSKQTRQFNSAFYLILTVGYIADFIFSCFWLLYDIFDVRYEWIQYCAFIMEWYTLFFLGIWNCVLGMNLCTAVGFPFKHSSFWSGKALYLIVTFILAFPFIVSGYSIPDLYCRVHIREFQCHSYQASYLLISAIIGTSFDFLALFFVFYGLSKASSSLAAHSSSTHSKTEKHLMLQTTVSSILQILMYASYAYASAFKSFDPSYVTFTSIGMILFLLQHYSNIAILFVVNQIFRKRFLTFYGISCSIPKKCQIQVIPAKCNY